jgi:hypothetical protein
MKDPEDLLAVTLPARPRSFVGEGSCEVTASCGDEEVEEEGVVGEDEAVVEFGFNGDDRFVVFTFSEKIFIAGGCGCVVD